MKKVILCLLLLVGSTQLIAQKKDTPTPEEVSKAKELKTAFEEEDLVIQSKTINIRFRKGSPSGKIGVIQTESTDYLNISSSCLLYTSPSPRDLSTSRMPSSA